MMSKITSAANVNGNSNEYSADKAPRNSRARLLGGTTAAALMLVPVLAFGQTWNGPVNGSWGNNTNWLPIGIPNSALADVIVDGTGGIGQIDLGGASFRINTLDISDASTLSNGRLVFDGAVSTFTYSGGNAGIDIQSDMRLALDNSVAFNVTTGLIANSDVQGINGPVQLTLNADGAASTIRMNGALTNGTGTLSLRVTGSGQTELAGANTFTGGTFVDAGAQLTVYGAIGDATSEGTLAFRGGDGGRITNRAGAMLIIDATSNVDHVDNASADAWNAGTLGTLRNTAGAFVNRGQITGLSTVLDGRLTNFGTVGDVVTTNGMFINQSTGVGAMLTNGGSALNVGTLDSVLNTGDFLNTGLVNDDVVVNAGMVVNEGTIGDDLIVNGGNAINRGTVTDMGVVRATAGLINNGIMGDVSVAAGGEFFNATGASAQALLNNGVSTNDGTLVSVFNTDEFRNLANGQVTGDVVSTGDLYNDGILMGNLTVRGGSAYNRNEVQGFSTIAAGADMTSSGTMADALVAGTLWVTGGSAGDIRSVGAGQYGISAGVSAGDILQGGAQGFNAGSVQDVRIDAGMFTNTGTINGTFVMNGGSALNGATGMVIGDTTIRLGQELGNSGTLADVLVSGGGEFNNHTGGSAGAVFNNGITLNAGTLASVVNTGTLRNVAGGVVSGGVLTSNALVNDGQISGALSVTAGDATNRGVVLGQSTIAAGASMVSSGTMADALVAGTLLVSGGSAGDILSTGAGVFGIAAGAMAGDIRQYGALGLNAGTVGTVRVEAGTFTNIGTINGQSRIAAGASLLSTNSMADALVAGDLQVTGGTAGDITSSGAGTYLIAAGASAGDILQNGASGFNGGDVDDVRLQAGTFTNVGTVNGTFYMNGATASNFGTITGDATILGGMLSNNGAMADAFVGLGGGLTNNATALDVVSHGYVRNNGTIASLWSDGLAENAAGIVNGDTVIAGGTLYNDGALAGNLSVRGGGVVFNRGNVGLATTIAAGSGVMSSGVLGDVTNRGILNITGGSAGDILNTAGGVVTIFDTATALVVTNQGNGLGGNYGTIAALENYNNASFLNNGLVTGTVLVGNGNVTNGGQGIVTGLLTQNGGMVQNAGQLNGGALVNGGVFANLSGGTITGTLVTSGLSSNAGEIFGDVTIAGRSLTNSATGLIVGDVANQSVLVSDGRITGDLDNQAGAIAVLTRNLDGGITNAIGGSVLIADQLFGLDSIGNSGAFMIGETGGASGFVVRLDHDATVFNAATFRIVEGTLRGSGSTVFQNQTNALLNIGVNGTLDMPLDNAVGGGVNVEGTLNGDVNNAGLMLLSGLVTGDVDNTGFLGLSGTLDGNLLNQAGADVGVDGPSAITGDVVNDGTFIIDDTLSFGLFENNGGPAVTALTSVGAGGTLITSGSTVTGTALTNNGLLAMQDGSTLNAALVNLGAFEVDGSVTVGAGGANGLTNEGILSMADGRTGDVITVNGDTVLNGTLRYDINLSGIAAPNGDAVDSTDFILVDGDVTGTATLAFNNVGSFFSQLGSDPTLIAYTGSSAGLDLSSSGLPVSGAVLYEVVNNTAAGEIQLNSGANPAIGGLASGIALNQSLIGSVINRPSAAAVGFYAGPDAAERPCGFSGWGRATGGRAESSGQTTTGLGVYDSELDASYSGMMLGFDRACSNGYYNGWSIGYGGLLGLNQGKMEQPVFAFDPTTGQINSNIVTSLNETDFRQTFGGLYMTAVRNQFAISTQYRYEHTSYDLENNPLGGFQGLGVADQSYESRGHTFAAEASYTHRLMQDKLIFVQPRLGFSYSKVETDDILFDNNPGAGDDGLLVIDEIETKIGYLSTTLFTQKPGADGRSISTYYATLTGYRDFADEVTTEYYQNLVGGQPVGAPLVSSGTNLGTFGEFSVGWNFQKLLDGGSALPARQMSTNIRADSRFGESLKSWGLTAQFQLQF